MSAMSQLAIDKSYAATLEGAKAAFKTAWQRKS
jgi:hypothetical protein